MKIGIVGLPNAGKTTLFNALTRAGGETAAYPFTTVEPNVAIVEVPDDRLGPLAEEAERRLERVRKQAASGSKEAVAERAWLERVIEAVGRGKPVRDVDVPAAAAEGPARLQALSSKPVLYVANVDEGEAEPPPELVEHTRGLGASIAISARIEAELAELPDEEAAE